MITIGISSAVLLGTGKLLLNNACFVTVIIVTVDQLLTRSNHGA